MAQIWKFPLAVMDRQELVLPALSDPLCVREQAEQPCIWVVCEASAAPRTLEIITRGTGHELGDNRAAYLGTYMLRGGAFVGHVFWRWKDAA